MTTQEKLKVLLADDHALIRDGLRSLIDAQPDMLVVGGASDGQEVLILAAETEPDLVLMDISMPVLDGIQATRRLKRELPAVKVLALTAYDNQAYLTQLLEAGASGYVLKKMAAKELIEAIRVVAAGGTYLDPHLTAPREEPVGPRLRGESRGGELTSREQEILTLIATGYTNKEISARLGISVKTVESHKGNIMAKLELKNRADAVRYALGRGWLERS
ncbi:MAG TPA: response regulator transcription factor [Pyrinomonadaceae bacterium]|nr:response regulator transcription factor [Pyrinomonadaceae bacterium]